MENEHASWVPLFDYDLDPGMGSPEIKGINPVVAM